MAQTAEITDSPIWDTPVVLAAGPSGNQIDVFTKPQNANDEASTNKTKTQTSLGQTGRLDEPESFDVVFLQVIYLFGTREIDVINIENTSYVEFYTAGTQTRAWEAPKMLLVSGGGFPFTGANSLTQGTPGQPGYPSPMAIYKLDRPIMLGINESFRAQWKFNGLSGALLPSSNVSSRWILRGPHYLVDVVAKDSTGKEYSTRRSR